MGLGPEGPTWVAGWLLASYFADMYISVFLSMTPNTDYRLQGKKRKTIHVKKRKVTLMNVK